MAELVSGALLSSFFQTIFGRMASSDFVDYFRKSKLDGLMKKLDITLNSINQVLDEAEKKQYQSMYVKKWLDDLKHVVYETDQLLDEIATHARGKKHRAEFQPITSKVRGLFTTFTNPFESSIKELLENLEFLANQKENLGLGSVTCTNNEGRVNWKLSSRLPSTSLVDQSSIYGREDDKEEIIQFLLSENNDSRNQVPIISIVGMGGMGKTTLAQLVYNDQRMLEQFELKAWVYVSENFDVVGLTKAILKSFHSLADAEDLNLLQLELKQRIMGKKFFLVLDEVWNEHNASWELLQLPFSYGSSGSKILVTARDRKVASVMKSTQLLHLKQLEEKDCWSLFVRHAFHDKNVSEYPNLKSIGKKIVDKCGGLPLAIKTMGNLLRTKFSQREWVKILKTDMWRLSDNNDINPALRLSYHILPSNLKRCFAYCSIFPKSYAFKKDELIKFWMAEGLLNCYGSNKNEDELGDELFDELESMSFFQQSRGKDLFIMHDLVNDLAKSVSGEFCLQIDGDKEKDIPEKTRYICCSPELEDGDKMLEHIGKCKGLRSLMAITRNRGSQRFKIGNDAQLVLFSRLKHLRMLSFRNCHLLELVDEISNLQLLRYLDLTSTGIQRLPDSICTLHNLQTLLLMWCRNLKELPTNFYKLINLRHLHLDYTPIEKMPEHIGRLNHLRTLTHFVVGVNSGSDIKKLKKLNHLQGRLEILGLENVTNCTDAAKANLNNKKHLEQLLLEYHCRIGNPSRSTQRVDSINEKHVLEALRPDSDLNRLIVRHYGGASFPEWFGGFHLHNLVSLGLDLCGFCLCLPPLGELPSLKKLSILGFRELENIGQEFYGNNSPNVPFKSLEVLQFVDMYKWNEWFCFEDGSEVLPLLKELSIINCPMLKKALPQHLPSLQKLSIIDCQELQALIPKADNICELRLEGCENILLNEYPSSLKNVIICGTRLIESSLEQILFNCASLQVLNVRGFNGSNLKYSSLDLRSSISLRTLDIIDWYPTLWPFALDLFTNLHSLVLYNCPHLESFPGGGLPLSLSHLKIKGCPKLIVSREEWGLFKLHSLKEFTISDDFENVESFPEENLLPPTINVLRFESCSKLRTINYRGLLHLKSLKSLSIVICPYLEYLPEEALLNSLSILSIFSCPLLKRRYRTEGEHWRKICHIPSVVIN